MLAVVVPSLGEHRRDTPLHEGEMIRAIEHAVVGVRVGHDVASVRLSQDRQRAIQIGIAIPRDRHIIVLAPQGEDIQIDHSGHLLNREKRMLHIILRA